VLSSEEPSNAVSRQIPAQHYSRRFAHERTTRELRRGTPEKSHRERRVEDARTGKKTPGEPGHTQAHGHTDEPHNHPKNPQTHPSDRETTESAADSTAAAPEPTAPRGRLGGRPLRTRPSRPPLHRGEPDTLTRQTTPEPRDAHIATNHRTHLSHPIKLGGGDGDTPVQKHREGTQSRYKTPERHSTNRHVVVCKHSHKRKECMCILV